MAEFNDLALSRGSWGNDLTAGRVEWTSFALATIVRRGITVPCVLA